MQKPAGRRTLLRHLEGIIMEARTKFSTHGRVVSILDNKYITAAYLSS